jgi:hypothetical protein
VDMTSERGRENDNYGRNGKRNERGNAPRAHMCVLFFFCCYLTLFLHNSEGQTTASQKGTLAVGTMESGEAPTTAGRALAGTGKVNGAMTTAPGERRRRRDQLRRGQGPTTNEEGLPLARDPQR